jgi:hypothetical protein
MGTTDASSRRVYFAWWLWLAGAFLFGAAVIDVIVPLPALMAISLSALLVVSHTQRDDLWNKALP